MTVQTEIDREIPPIVSEKAWDPYVDVIHPKSWVRGWIRAIRKWMNLPTTEWAMA